MRVRYSLRAINDLNSISSYLAERNSAGARAVEEKIRSTLTLLARFPGMGRPLKERPHVRVMPVVRYPYLIFYVVQRDALIVLHIRHGARAPLQPDEP